MIYCILSWIFYLFGDISYRISSKCTTDKWGDIWYQTYNQLMNTSSDYQFGYDGEFKFLFWPWSEDTENDEIEDDY